MSILIHERKLSRCTADVRRIYCARYLVAVGPATFVARISVVMDHMDRQQDTNVYIIILRRTETPPNQNDINYDTLENYVLCQAERRVRTRSVSFEKLEFKVTNTTCWHQSHADDHCGWRSM